MRAVTVDLTLGQAPGSGHNADLRITLPGSAAPITPLLVPAPVALDLTHLCSLTLDPHVYGRAVSRMLFADGGLRGAFAQARAVTTQQAVPLRLCLTIRPEASELHAVRWECLADPDAPDQPLAAGGQVLLSRTLPSADWSTLTPRPARPLRTVALIAAPVDLADYGLSPINASQEIAQVHAALVGCVLSVLGSDARATQPALLGQLQAGCDLLFLLAHGRIDEKGQTWLYLEDDTGDTAPTPGATLVARIAALPDKPRLIILPACESAGNGSGYTLAALGPQLVRAGVPAVLAIQGRISRETLGRFLSVCLQALIGDGQIDRAVAIARQQVADRPDWWAPALWMRPGDGVLWSTPTVAAAPAGPAQALHQLRAPVADFVGRNAEVERLVAALRGATGGCAAISGVRGMGGLGKTELAHAVAAQLQHEYPDAQLLLELRGASDNPLSPAQALQQMIRAFRPEEKLPEEVPALQAIYRSVLTGKRALLLVDDAKDAAQVRPLLPPAGCVLLVTSRQRFALDGMTTLDLSRLDETAAIMLLRGICARLTGEQAKKIARLCGYLPLALRVSAGLLLNDEALPVERYLSRLADERQRLALLRDPDEPARDVEASLLLSYAGLDKQTQAHFRRLGAIAADADLALVAAMLELREDQADNVMRTLLRRSLVEYDVTRERWSLHDLVRDCAFGLLIKTNEERTARLHYAKQVIGIINEADRRYQAGGDGMLEGLALFDCERSHLEAVRGWLWRQLPSAEIDTLFIAEVNATLSIGELRDSLQMIRVPQLKQALVIAQRQGDRAAEIHYLIHLGEAYRNLGEVKFAIDCFKQNLIITQETGARYEEGQVLGYLGLAYRNLGDVRQAINYYDQHLIIARESGDRRGESIALGNIGNAYWSLGEVYNTIIYCMQRLNIAQEIGDLRGEAIALGSLGLAYIDMNNLSHAMNCYKQALGLIRKVGDRPNEAFFLAQIGRIHLKQDDPWETLNHNKIALTLVYTTEERQLEGIILRIVADAYAALGQITEVTTHYIRSLTILETIGDQSELARTRWAYGQFLVQQGDRECGIDLMAQCVAYEQRIGHAKAEEHAALVEQLRAGGDLPA